MFREHLACGARRSPLLPPMANDIPLAEQVGTVLSRAYFSVSGNGVLVYREGTTAQSQFSRYDRTGRVVARFGPAGGDYQDVALSPDGSRVAYSRPTPASYSSCEKEAWWRRPSMSGGSRRRGNHFLAAVPVQSNALEPFTVVVNWSAVTK